MAVVILRIRLETESAPERDFLDYLNNNVHSKRKTEWLRNRLLYGPGPESLPLEAKRVGANPVDEIGLTREPKAKKEASVVVVPEDPVVLSTSEPEVATSPVVEETPSSTSQVKTGSSLKGMFSGVQ